MQYSREVEEMFCVAKGAKHDPAPIPEEGKWVRENAEQMLNAAMQDEKNTQQRLNKAMQQPRSRKLEKNW